MFQYKRNNVPIASALREDGPTNVLPIDEVEPKPGRMKRADAQRKVRSLLRTAMTVFETSGVDAPVREIATKAGVGLGTVYRHFPKRSDLIVAVLQNEVDACAADAALFAARYEPGEALARWASRFVDFIGKKRGLAKAIYSGDPAYRDLPAYFSERLVPTLRSLLDSAVAADVARPDIDAEVLLHAMVTLCRGPRDEHPASARQMVELLVNGLRCSAESATSMATRSLGVAAMTPAPRLGPRARRR